MGLVAAIRKDIVFKFTGEVVSRLAFLVFFFYVGRKFSAADFGTLNLAISLAYILSVLFLDPGLNISAIQLLVGDTASAQRIAGAIFSLKVLLFAPMLIVLAVVSAMMGSRVPGLGILLLAAFYAFANALLEYFSSVTNAYHRMDLEALLKIGNRFSIVLFGIVAVHLGAISMVLWAMCIATGMWWIAAWMLVDHSCQPIGFRWDPQTMWRALRTGIPVAGALIICAVYLKWDLVVLSAFNIDRQQIGWYAAGFKIVEAGSTIPTMLGAALFPTLVRLRIEKPDQLNRLLRMTTKALAFIAIPAAACISTQARPLIQFVYGAHFLPAAGVLAVLIWCVVPMFLYFYLIFVNIAAGHAKHNVIAGSVALAVGLLTNIVLIPRIGYLGAAWAALAANCSFALLATWKVCSEFRAARIPVALVRVCLAGAIMFAILHFAPGPAVLQVAAALGGYLLALFALGTVSADDVYVLRAMRPSSAVATNVQV